MSKGVKGFYIFTWGLLILSTFFQFLGIASVTNLFGHAESAVEISFLPLWILATVLLPVAAVLCGVFSKKENWPYLPMAIALVGTLLALIVVFSMSGVDAFQERFDTRGFNDTLGLTTFSLLYRHGLPVLVGVFLIILCRLNHQSARDARVQAENDAYKEHYQLDGKPLFKDEESTLGLNEYAEDFSVVKKTKKLKKSQKIAKEKQQKKR
ncbi:MAG: hypothetical protein E7527_05065 [Ruminococcaceae bacterium]|nr:hypothetical protein [Oscillospiraceae bacterium]